MKRPATKWKPETARFGGAIWYKVCRTLSDGTMEAAGEYYKQKKDAQAFADELNREPFGTIHRGGRTNGTE